MNMMHVKGAVAAGLMVVAGSAVAQWGYANSTSPYLGALGANPTFARPAAPAFPPPATQYTPPVRGLLTVVPQGGYFDGGYARAENRQHLGTDYSAASGTPVYAIAGGQVRINTTNQSNPYNSQVTVQQADGSRVIYGHVYSTTTPGQTLGQGQYVGYVQGPNSAQPTYAPHLHLGMNTQPHNIEGGWGRAPASTTRQQAGQAGWVDPNQIFHGARR